MISYLVDVYQNKFVVSKNIFDILLTFSFFPIILAGPISRPIKLLPQIQTNRIFNYSQIKDGLRQILWGIFMKIVIADYCSIYVNPIFASSSTLKGSTLILGVLLYTVQIYSDFAGYSNIAIGIGKLLGFNIMQNFAYPYFAKDVREFWQRWNISLTSWFRDYIFLPIAYYMSGKIKSKRCIKIKTELFIYIIGVSITWILTGLWHGANYTFIIWGLIQGFFLIVNHLISKSRRKLIKRFKVGNNYFLSIFDSVATLLIIMLSWIFFRANNIDSAISIILEIFSKSFFATPEISKRPLLIIMIFFVFEWIGRKDEFAIAKLGASSPRIVRWTFYYAFIGLILWFSLKGPQQQFIYVQF